jgi:methylene-fatty-acyl-phospholipid synthase
MFGGNARYGCYFLAIMIFSFGVLRDHLYVQVHDNSGRHCLTPSRYQRALSDQPRVSMLAAPYDTLVPIVLFAIGQLFVVTSTLALGITGTFLGDYFGILMDHRVQGFPFNVLRDPMYVGSTMCFVATALWYVSSSVPHLGTI